MLEFKNLYTNYTPSEGIIPDISINLDDYTPTCKLCYTGDAFNSVILDEMRHFSIKNYKPEISFKDNLKKLNSYISAYYFVLNDIYVEYSSSVTSYKALFEEVFGSSSLRIVSLKDKKFIAGLGLLILIETDTQKNIFVPLICSAIKNKYMETVNKIFYVKSDINPKIIDVLVDTKLTIGKDTLTKAIRIAFKDYISTIKYNLVSLNLEDVVVKFNLPKFRKPSEKKEYFDRVVKDALALSALGVNLI